MFNQSDRLQVLSARIQFLFAFTFLAKGNESFKCLFISIFFLLKKHIFKPFNFFFQTESLAAQFKKKSTNSTNSTSVLILKNCRYSPKQLMHTFQIVYQQRDQFLRWVSSFSLPSLVLVCSKDGAWTRGNPPSIFFF